MNDKVIKLMLELLLINNEISLHIRASKIREESTATVQQLIAERMEMYQRLKEML